jgi:very-short-patch-repair endonuclease
MNNIEVKIKCAKGGHSQKGIPKGPLTEIAKQKIRIARSKQIFPLKDTKIEIKIREFLDILQIEYFQHKYISEITHSYQCDFFIPSKNLVIECDGDYWHKYPTGNEIDHIRTKELIEKGFKVLRLWENEIKIIDINKFNDIIKETDNFITHFQTDYFNENSNLEKIERMIYTRSL